MTAGASAVRQLHRCDHLLEVMFQLRQFWMGGTQLPDEGQHLRDGGLEIGEADALATANARRHLPQVATPVLQGADLADLEIAVLLSVLE